MHQALRIVAVAATLAACGLPSAGAFVPAISIEPAAEPDPSGPVVSFTLPKYQISTLDRETVAACLILEAACQGEFGMRGVMAVIRNRSRGLPEMFAPTVLRPKQFSALNRVTAGRETLWRAITRARKDRMWQTALAIVDDALQDNWYDPTGGATHYTRSGERTHWTKRLAMTVRIGAHSFYR